MVPTNLGIKTHGNDDGGCEAILANTSLTVRTTVSSLTVDIRLS